MKKATKIMGISEKEAMTIATMLLNDYRDVFESLCRYAVKETSEYFDVDRYFDDIMERYDDEDTNYYNIQEMIDEKQYEYVAEEIGEYSFLVYDFTEYLLQKLKFGKVLDPQLEFDEEVFNEIAYAIANITQSKQLKDNPEDFCEVILMFGGIDDLESPDIDDALELCKEYSDPNWYSQFGSLND